MVKLSQKEKKSLRYITKKGSENLSEIFVISKFFFKY